ncbi:MAG: hypothetical protein Q9219_001347 [cf. Caloplaca sp. 3 TL-2023]
MDDHPQISPLDHVEFMRYALALAQKSPPKPTNFRVGALLVDEAENRILASGFTLELPGNTHAEQCALQKYSSAHGVAEVDLGKVLPTQTVLYTTMEPCQKRSLQPISRPLAHKPPIYQTRKMASDLGIENTNIKTASGVTLDENQKTLVGSVLDLFAGRPSLKKLSLWTDDAVFEDNITIATGRKQFEPQWYGLQTAFSEIERLHHEVVSAGNPIGMDMKTRYVTKGISKEQIIESRINIFYDKDTNKITKVQDKWGGELPDSSFKNVSIEQLLDPWWWVHYAEGWAWWLWSFTWDTRWWQAMRQLNSVSVPKMVSVPKNDEEDAKRTSWFRRYVLNRDTLLMCEKGQPDINKGQNTYFYLNHPIRWVRLVGVVVAFDIYPNRAMMTLDDSSGFTIEIFCRKEKSSVPIVETKIDCHGVITINKPVKPVDDEYTYTTNEGYKVSLEGIDLGSVVKVKGGISEFRGEKQVTLERICKSAGSRKTLCWFLILNLEAMIRTTNEEASAWAETASFYQDVLSKPWIISERAQLKAKMEAEGLAREREARRERRRRQKELKEKSQRKAKQEHKHNREKTNADVESKLDAHDDRQGSRKHRTIKPNRRRHVVEIKNPV